MCRLIPEGIKIYLALELDAVPLLTQFHAWLPGSYGKVPKRLKIGEATRYLLTYWTQLTAYLKHGTNEIDNNLIENTLRPLTLDRKNWLLVEVLRAL